MNSSRVIMGLLVAMAMAIGGCGAPRADAPAARPQRASAGAGPAASAADGSRIDVVNLYAMPAAINWDDKPGADGLQVRVFFFRLDEPQAVDMTDGLLEFTIHAGRVPASKLPELPPIKTWRFTAAELAVYRTRSVVGTGYVMSLPWGDRTPASPSVTLSARLVRGDRAVYAAPIFLAIGPR